MTVPILKTERRRRKSTKRQQPHAIFSDPVDLWTVCCCGAIIVVLLLSLFRDGILSWTHSTGRHNEQHHDHPPALPHTQQHSHSRLSAASSLVKESSDTASLTVPAHAKKEEDPEKRISSTATTTTDFKGIDKNNEENQFEEPLMFWMNDDETMKKILGNARTIALVGASADPSRPSNSVLKFLLEQGYTVIPVNPNLAATSVSLYGQPVVSSLSDIREPIDLVDIFRSKEEAGKVVEEAIAIQAKSVWMQTGILHIPAAKRATEAGLDVVMDACTKIEFLRFFLLDAPRHLRRRKSFQ